MPRSCLCRFASEIHFRNLLLEENEQLLAQVTAREVTSLTFIERHSTRACEQSVRVKMSPHGWGHQAVLDDSIPNNSSSNPKHRIVVPSVS